MANYFAGNCTYRFDVFFQRSAFISWRLMFSRFQNDTAVPCNNAFTCTDYYGPAQVLGMCSTGAPNNTNPALPLYRTFSSTSISFSNGLTIGGGFYVKVMFARANLANGILISESFRYSSARITNNVTGGVLNLSTILGFPITPFPGGYPQRGVNLGVGGSNWFSEYGDVCYFYEAFIFNNYIANGNGFFPGSLRQILTYDCQPCI